MTDQPLAPLLTTTHDWIACDGSSHCYWCGETLHQVEDLPDDGCLSAAQKWRKFAENPTGWSRTSLVRLAVTSADELDAQRAALATAEAERDKLLDDWFRHGAADAMAERPTFSTEPDTPERHWYTRGFAWMSANLDRQTLMAERDLLREQVQVISEQNEQINTYIATIKDLQEQVRALTAWRPMETAPKDGTEIVAWMHDDAPCRAWLASRQSGVALTRWTDRNGGGWVSYHPGVPTHWLPLPLPPTEDRP